LGLFLQFIDTRNIEEHLLLHLFQHRNVVNRMSRLGKGAVQDSESVINIRDSSVKQREEIWGLFRGFFLG